VSSYALLNVVIDKVFELVWFAVGALIFLLRSDERMALLASLFLIAFGTVTVDPTDAHALASSQPAWWLPVQGVEIVGEVCVMLFFLLFPGGRFVPRWTRWLAVAWLAYTFPQEDLFSGCVRWFTSLGGGFGVGVYRVRGEPALVANLSLPEGFLSTAASTDQVGGVRNDLGCRGNILLQGAVGRGLGWWRHAFCSTHPQDRLCVVLSVLVPLSISVAVLGSHLFDIDILINCALVYGLVTAMLVALYFGGIVLLQRAFVALTGQKQTIAVVASTLAIAAVFNPLRRRIQAFIDRRFYRRKYDARKTLEAFSARLRDETDLEALGDDLVVVVRETIQPAHVSLWLRPDTPTQRDQSD
jgi:hypothetical protein